MAHNCPKCQSKAVSGEIVGPGQVEVAPCGCVTHPKDTPNGLVEKSHQCEECGAGFTERGSLLRHQRDIHGATTAYVCQECGVEFPSSNSLGGHVVAEHGVAQKTQFTTERLEDFWAGKSAEERVSMVKEDLDGFAEMENHPQWSGGVHSQTQRKIVESHRGVEWSEISCDVCATPHDDGGRKHAVHHKDGDDTNNDPENLAVLCGSCHRRVHNRADHALMNAIKDSVPELHTVALLESLKSEKQNQREENGCMT